jgi:hypothetical protein
VRLKPAPDRDDPEDGDQVNNVPPRMPLRFAVDDVSCDRLLFGDFRNEPSARDHVEARLQQRIESIHALCRLTVVQMEKLDLAGRGDIKRLVARAEDVKPKIRAILSGNGVKELEPAALKLCRDSDSIRSAFASGPFDTGSLFANTLKQTLTVEQSTALEKAARQSRDR